MDVTWEDMIKRFDLRQVLRLSFDDAEETTRYENELKNSAILAAALADAKGALIAAVTVAGFYSEDKLSRLTPESEALAKRIVCELALSNLYLRRGTDNFETVERLRKAAEEYLDRLRNGERLFSIVDDQSAATAGLPSLVAPDVVQLHNINGIANRASGYFGPVADRQHISKYKG